jgi:hypothetical protein
MMKCRKHRRPKVILEQPLDVGVMTIDRTWFGDCVLIDTADTGARLKMTGYAIELTGLYYRTSRLFSHIKLFQSPSIPSLQESVGRRPALWPSASNKTDIRIKPLEEVRREAELV